MDTKGLLASKTIQGVLIAAAPLLAKWLDISPEFMTEAMMALVQVVGLIYAVYGRYRAEKKLKGIM